MKRKNAFTLIELLVVIAVIALLMAIVMPGLRKAKEYAKKVICQSNQRQIGIAIGSYTVQFGFDFRTYPSAVGLTADQLKKHWFFENGTGDLPYEDQSNYARDLMKNEMLPDRKIFFCPGVRNVSHEKNYRYNEALAGNITYYEVSSTEHLMETDSSFTDRPAFWSTYAWLWKKGDDGRGGINYLANNNSTNNVLLCDVPNSFWQLAMDIGNNDGTVLENIFGGSEGTIQTIAHGNVLMKDLSVQNPADKDEEYNLWLWNTPTWAGN